MRQSFCSWNEEFLIIIDTVSKHAEPGFWLSEQLSEWSLAKQNKYSLILLIYGTPSLFYLLTAAIILKRKIKKRKAQHDIQLPPWQRLQWKSSLLHSLHSLSSSTCSSLLLYSNICSSSHQYLAQYLLFTVIPPPTYIPSLPLLLLFWSKPEKSSHFVLSFGLCPHPSTHIYRLRYIYIYIYIHTQTCKN